MNDGLSKRAFLQFALPLAIAAAGGFLAYLVGAPGSWLIGAMLAVMAFAIAGQTILFPNRLRDILFVMLGLIFGSSMSPDMLAQMSRWPTTMALVPVTVVLIIVSSTLYYRFIAGWDRASSLLASIPGALSHVMSVAEGAGADLKRVGIAQTTRVILLAVFVSILMQDQAVATRPHIAPVSVGDFAIVTCAGVAGALLFRFLRIPGAMVSGATFASALMYANGAVTGAFPQYLVIGGYILLGMMIGARFSGASMDLLRRYVAISAGAFMVVFLASCLGALAAVYIAGTSFGLALLAYAPGAFEAMAALALVTELDPAFVIAHHMVRYFGIILFTPVFLMFLRPGNR